MASLSVSDNFKARAEAKALAEGFRSVEEYLASLVDNDVGGPPESTVDSDDELEERLLARLNDASVPMDAADFAQMRSKLDARLGKAGEQS